MGNLVEIIIDKQHFVDNHTGFHSQIMASSFEMDFEETDELLYSLNTSTPDADNSNLSSSLPDTGDDDEGSTLIIDGKEYVETQNLARLIRKSSSKKSSSIWKLVIELKRVDDSAKFWQCVLCKKKDKFTLYKTSATSGAFRHLKKEHGIVEANKRFIRLENQSTRPTLKLLKLRVRTRQLSTTSIIQVKVLSVFSARR